MEFTAMKITKYAVHVLFGLTLGAGLSMTSAVLAKDDAARDEATMSATQPGALFLPSADPMADLAVKMEAARESHKQLLVVMGGNWCHDSRALASRLFTDPLSTTIDEHYETLFVDVGYLEKGREVITSLGIPVYYATPTVLIVDPVNGEVVNAQNRHQWAEAASISMEDSLAYFRQYKDAGQTTIERENDAQLLELLAEIDAFEQAQAGRLYEAYAALGPMLQAYKEGDKEAFSEELWNEVRDYRYKVPVDLVTLKTEARERVAAGETDITLNYPVYPAFSWDAK
jgi:hypothetical protein